MQVREIVHLTAADSCGSVFTHTKCIAIFALGAFTSTPTPPQPHPEGEWCNFKITKKILWNKRGKRTDVLGLRELLEGKMVPICLQPLLHVGKVPRNDSTRTPVELYAYLWMDIMDKYIFIYTEKCEGWVAGTLTEKVSLGCQCYPKFRQATSAGT